MRVEVRHNNVEKALRTLKKKLFDEDRIKILMACRFYEKPSAKRRRRKLEAINRQKKVHEREKAGQDKHSRKRRWKK